MSMKDILGKLARIDESMKSDAKKPTGPKFPGYWKGKDPASQSKNKMVGGAAEESILRDLEKALTESPARNLKEEYKRYSAEWCGVCGQSPCNCTSVNEGEVIPFPKREEPKPQAKKSEPKKDNVKAISKDRYAKTGPRTMQGPTLASIYEGGYDDVVRKVAHLATIYMQSENLQSMMSVEEYIYKKMGVQSAVNEDSSEFVLYVNGKPAAKYNDLGKAEQDIHIVKQRVPSAKCEIKQEVCKMTTIASKVTESFIAALTETFNSKQEVIDHFVKQGKSAAAGAAAWERGYRGQQTKPTNMKDFKFKKPPVKNWQELDEYGTTGTTGVASQAPAGTTAQDPDPAQAQAKVDQQQIQKNTNAIAGQLNQQGAAQSLNKVKFSDTMTKLDDQPNTDLSAQELKQLEPLAVATSKALQNPQTASQMKQLISKSDTVDKQKEMKVKQQQQQIGTNQPAGQQPTQTPSAGQTT